MRTIALIIFLSASVLNAQDAVPEASTTIMHLFSPELTIAIIGLIGAVTAWFAAKNKFSKVAATVDGKVDVTHQPSFPEEAYRKFVTKDEFSQHRAETLASVVRIHDKIDAANKENADFREATSRQLGSIDSSITRICEKLFKGKK